MYINSINPDPSSMFFIEYNGTDLRVVSRNSTSTREVTGAWDFYHTYSINTNTWYHITATFNTTKLTLYINGIEKANDTTARTSWTNVESNTFRLGMSYDGTKPFNGSIDEFRI